MNDKLDTDTKAAMVAGASPADLAWAKSRLSKKEFQGWCQAFVRQATGGLTQGATAIEAFNNAQNKVIGNLNGIKPGDLVYFEPNASNGGAGHTGIYSGNNQFISATNNGIQENNLSDWEKNTGQVIAGYVPNTNNAQPLANMNPPQGLPNVPQGGTPTGLAGPAPTLQT